jgi:AICAR transformylase/IMP cyclohydrolase PurH
VASQSLSQPLFPPLKLIVNSSFSHSPAYKDASFLHQKYVVERLSIQEIADQIYSSTSTIAKYIRQAGIEPRPFDMKNSNRLRYGEVWRRRQVDRHKRELQYIEKMRSLRAKGFSYWKIADVMNAMEVPTKTGRRQWHARSVQQIMVGGKIVSD